MNLEDLGEFQWEILMGYDPRWSQFEIHMSIFQTSASQRVALKVSFSVLGQARWDPDNFWLVKDIGLNWPFTSFWVRQYATAKSEASVKSWYSRSTVGVGKLITVRNSSLKTLNDCSAFSSDGKSSDSNFPFTLLC